MFLEVVLILVFWAPIGGKQSVYIITTRPLSALPLKVQNWFLTAYRTTILTNVKINILQIAVLDWLIGI